MKRILTVIALLLTIQAFSQNRLQVDSMRRMRDSIITSYNGNLPLRDTDALYIAALTNDLSVASALARGHKGRVMDTATISGAQLVKICRLAYQAAYSQVRFLVPRLEQQIDRLYPSFPTELKMEVDAMRAYARQLYWEGAAEGLNKINSLK